MIAILDYGLGNLASVENMFRKIGVKEVTITKQPEQIAQCKKLLLPGVGAFDAGMTLLEQTGLIPLLNHKILVEKVPVLGICLGMQMLGKGSEEGKLNGLGWIDAHSVKFNPPAGSQYKVPHMGWEYVQVIKENPLLSREVKSRFYFVHSYHVVCEDLEQSIGIAKFDHTFTCMVNKENIFGTQFHPEKSLRFGMEVLLNFSKL